MSIDLATVESMVLTLADGTALLYPPAAPVIALLKGGLETLEKLGIVPTPTSAVNIDQVRAQAAGIAAAQASAVTSFREHKP